MSAGTQERARATGPSHGSRRLSLVASLLIVVAAVAVCIFQPGGAKEYRSSATLFYSGSQGPSSDPSPLPDQVAMQRLSAGQLDSIGERFNLYPKPQDRSANAAGLHLLSRLSLEPLDEHRLTVSFRDDDGPRCRDVTNAVADLLAAWEPEGVRVLSSWSAPRFTDRSLGDSPAVASPSSELSPTSRASAPPAKGPGTTMAAQRLSQIAGIDARVRDLTHRDAELSLELARRKDTVEPTGVGSAALSGGDSPVKEAPEASLQRQLADARHRLAELRERYTDAYPDVEDARDEIATVERKLAQTTPSTPLASDIGSHQREEAVRKGQQPAGAAALERERERDELEIVHLGRDRDRLSASLGSSPPSASSGLSSLAGSGKPGGPESTLPAADRTLAADSDGPAPSDPASVDFGSFRILRRATISAETRHYRPVAFLWIGLATAALLAFCLLPIVPVRFASLGPAEGE